MSRSTKIGKSVMHWGSRTYIMGILNITPDSFSDGGEFIDKQSALNRTLEMIQQGADIIDIGGESTRPGAVPISEELETGRILPVIASIKSQTDIPISVDTYKSRTAIKSLEAGADMINDIFGLKRDAEMARVIADFNVPVCIMHNSETGIYSNLLDEIITDLKNGIELALQAGVKEENIIIDPGIGFGKTWEQNIETMIGLEKIKEIGFPLLLGTSRKSFIGKVLDLPVQSRLEGTIATTVFGITKGADIIRVHDVIENKRAAMMADRLVRL